MIYVIMSDRVFGCHLSTLCEREGTTVPKFVQICLDAVEKRGTFAHRRVTVSFLSDFLYFCFGLLASLTEQLKTLDSKQDETEEVTLGVKPPSSAEDMRRCSELNGAPLPDVWFHQSTFLKIFPTTTTIMF